MIDRLETLVNAGTRVPLTSKALVDEQEFLELVDQLRVAVPDEVRHAKRVSQERERMITQAQVDAEQLLANAQERAEQAVQQSEIVRYAQQQAEEIVVRAEEESRRMRAGADNYAMEVLEGLENELNRLLAMVRKGKAALEKLEREDGAPRRDGGAGIASRPARAEARDGSAL